MFRWRRDERIASERHDQSIRESRRQTRAARSGVRVAWLGVAATIVVGIPGFLLFIHRPPPTKGLDLKVVAFSIVTGSTTIQESNALDQPIGEREFPATTIDITLKNDGATDAVMTRIAVSIRLAQQIKECERGAGELYATGSYNVTLPDADTITSYPYTVHTDVRREIPPGSADRFQLRLGPRSSVYAQALNFYLVDVNADVFEMDAPFPLGSALVTDLESTSPERFFADESSGDIDCVARNKESVKSILAAAPGPDERFAQFERLADGAEPRGPWPIQCVNSRAVPTKVRSVRKDVTGDALPEVVITVRCDTGSRSPLEHVIAYPGSDSDRGLSGQVVSPNGGLTAAATSWDGESLIVEGRTPADVDLIVRYRWTWRSGAFAHEGTDVVPCERDNLYICINR